MGVKTIKPRQNFSQGSLQQTNGSLDLAIMGEGFLFLEVQLVEKMLMKD